jgi:hypothetical protein
MDIKAFNTGRQYSAKGQRIAYTVLASGNVAMVDVDRGLDYVLRRLHYEFALTDSMVLRLYDCNFTGGSGEDERELYRLRSVLEAAARAI